MIFGLSATLLVTLAGGGSDYARLVSRRSQLQSAADAGALAGGNALKLAMSNPNAIVGLVDTTIRAAANVVAERPFTTQVSVSDDRTSVSAKVQEDVPLTFGRLVGMASAKVGVQSRANVVGRMRLCMLALDPAAAGAFNLEKNAQVTALGCTLYSDSSASRGMVGRENALAKAQTICSAGGFDGARANFTPTPQTDCPVIKDPLADRALPSVGGCITMPTAATQKAINVGGLLYVGENRLETAVTLDPGTYCGGLHITKKASVTLRPGIYVMKDGPLVVDGKASMTGTDVGFFFTGNRGGLLFDKKTTISLTAPASGPMAGLLMAEERSVANPIDPVLNLVGELVDGLLEPPPSPTPLPIAATRPMRIYRVISDNARTMLGTIYLPAGRLVIDASKPVADQSAYTVIVAQQVNLYEGPNLYLNANYDATSVPVPKGVGNVSGKLVLTQ